jgi:hypothetical protein
MKKLLIISLMFLGILSCKEKSKTSKTVLDNKSKIIKMDTSINFSPFFLSEFQIYSFKSDSKGFNRTFVDPVKPSYVNLWLDERDNLNSINNTKLNFDDSEKTITLKELSTLCNGDSKGSILFIFGINESKNITLDIVGTKEISNDTFEEESRIKIDLKPEDLLNYQNIGNELNKTQTDNGYKEFGLYKYIHFSKEKTKEWLSNLAKIPFQLDDSSTLYLNFGYSRNSKNSLFHPSVLISSTSVSRTNRPEESDIDKYAFGNRNGGCCPPQ